MEQTLKPDEQMWIDVGKLIREHVPDKNGKTLPADLTYGSYEFRDLTDIAVGSLFEGKVIYDKTYGHVAYGCASCCAYDLATMIYDPLGIPFQGNSLNGVTALESCSGTFGDVSSYFYYNWSTANTRIATVNTTGKHTGVGVGSTNSNTWANLIYSEYKPCVRKHWAPIAGVNVQAPVPTRVEPIATTSQGAMICSNGQGWSRFVTNQLQDQFSHGYLHAGILMADTLSFTSTNQLALSPETGSAKTDSNGSWPDFYGDCGPKCPSSGESDAIQSWTFNGTGLPHLNLVIYKCASITIDGR